MTIAKLEKRKLIIFDLDGTLVDTVFDMAAAINAALHQMGLPTVNVEQIRLWVGQGSEQLCRRVLTELNYNDEALTDELCKVYLAHYHLKTCVDSIPFVGVYEFLEDCKTKKRSMACVTNKPRVLAMRLLEKLNLLDYFSLVVGGDTVAEKKPSPLPLIYTMRYFNLKHDQVLMIGDSRNDIEAARGAEIDCIAMSYGYNHGESIYDSHPQEVIDDLRCLLKR
ncbi:phosphoglycolate phosphatase [Acinetobacter nectaris]|uniref:phosphoglycolate phosphatase n=1 Tax=Acinetobacter nectaris TaxID=1219382 RepID=UPI001F02DC0E|nr:phosphoglycolate phosphatase [Acinetobacter nectaris]MCF8999409.1 phosphoglycolate phosphatase [Acinetobacter nectaris]MCF9027123.1 phosphoglycolate phosphatase [Acinetobacter nectaris]